MTALTTDRDILPLPPNGAAARPAIAAASVHPTVSQLPPVTPGLRGAIQLRLAFATAAVALVSLLLLLLNQDHSEKAISLGDPFLIIAIVPALALGVLALRTAGSVQGLSRACADEILCQTELLSARLDEIEEGSRDWLWETGPDLRFTYASPKLQSLLGIDPSNPGSMKLAALSGSLSCEDRGWARLLGLLVQQQRVETCDIEAKLNGVSRWFRLSARPLHTANGEFLGYRGLGRDVTTEKEAIESLVAAKAEAESANEAKSQFLAIMSHELRTPLNAIVGFSELLASPQAENLAECDQNDHLRTILESGRHLQMMVDDILDASRIERGGLRLAEQEGDAAELLEVSVKLCRRIAEESECTIVANLTGGIDIKGDIARLEQILVNLVSNAAKYSPPGSLVSAGLERLGNGALAFVVRDKGIGIDAPDIERMFQPFMQSDTGATRRFGGIGLGLSIARKLARLHGGDVTLESEVGIGTTARLILPAARVTWPNGPAAAKSPG